MALASQQDLGSLVGRVTGTSPVGTRLVLGLILVGLVLWFIFKSADFRKGFDNILGGVVIGLAVLGAWYVTASMLIDADGEVYSWAQYADPNTWSFFEDGERPRSVAVQSYTFINPMGETYRYATQGFNSMFLTFGVMAVLGVIGGSLVWALLSRGFRFEWFASRKDFLTHLIGAILMGVGGVLAMGCTVGQAITGVSTLALGSFLAFGSIVFGSAMTMKIQYYKMVYEDEATFAKAFITALVDLRLLPAGMRKLEAV
jgi:uncharacterized membrane protein YedE/YeeE